MYNIMRALILGVFLFAICFSQSKDDSFINHKKCTPIGIRTPNLLVRSQTLYPVELWVHFNVFVARRGIEPLLPA